MNRCNQVYSPTRMTYCVYTIVIMPVYDTIIPGVMTNIHDTYIFQCISHPPHHRSANTLRPRQNGRHFPDDILKCIFLNGNAWMSLKISLKFIPDVRINNIPAVVHIMAWRRPGDKPLSEPMMVRLLTHICVTRPQWVNQRRIMCRNTPTFYCVVISSGVPASRLFQMCRSRSVVVNLIIRERCHC